jgi:hypothetical protein
MTDRELFVSGYISVMDDETDAEVVARLASAGMHTMDIEVEDEGTA